MKPLLSCLTCLWIAVAAPVTAQQSPVVVELFTSQGCSSCPPADEILSRLATRDDVLPLSLHVDYWDYIGWKDEFADPAYSDRQRRYAQAAGRKMVYTPQMIVNGRDDVVGARALDLADLIMKHHDADQPVQLTVDRDGGRLRIRARAEPGFPPGRIDVQLVHFQPSRQTRITRGENAGRTLSYANVVDGWTVVGRWDGRRPLDLTVPMQGAGPVAVLLQRPGPGEIVAAARLD